MKSRRIVDKKLMHSFKDKKCLLCNRQAVFAHVKTRGSGGDDVIENSMPLCGIHHDEQGRIGIVTFVEKYPIVENNLASKGWRIVEIFGRKKLMRENF